MRHFELHVRSGMLRAAGELGLPVDAMRLACRSHRFMVRAMHPSFRLCMVVYDRVAILSTKIALDFAVYPCPAHTDNPLHEAASLWGSGHFQYCNKDGSLGLRQNPAFKLSQTIKPHLHKRRKVSQPIHSPSARDSASTSNRLEARSLAATPSVSSGRALNTKLVYRYKYIVDPTSVR
jgi:hypothetical protein